MPISCATNAVPHINEVIKAQISEKNNLELYVRNSEEKLLKGVRDSKIIETENVMEKEELKENLSRIAKTNRHGKKCKDSLVER